MRDKKSARGISLILVATLIVSVAGGIWWSGKQNISYAKEVFYDTEKMVQQNISAGSAFTVLEIVPTLEDARIGYLIGGCEPDLQSEGITDVLRAEGLLTDDVNSTVAYPLTCDEVEVIESATERPDLVAEGYKEILITPSPTPEATATPEVTATPEPTQDPLATATPEATQDPETTATPEVTPDPSATATPEPTATSDPLATATPEPSTASGATAAITQNFIVLTSEVTATAEPTATPEATATPEPGVAATPEPTATPTVPEGTIYIYEREIIRNNEFFKKYVLGMEASFDQLRVNVVVKTPTELTETDIKSADLIYISGRNAAGYLQSDLTVDVAKELVNNITSDKIRKPTIVDYALVTQIEGATTDNWTGTNLYKACMVLLGEEPGEIYATIENNWNDSIGSEAWKPVVNARSVINSGHFVRENVYWFTYRTAEYESAKGVAGQTYYFVNNDLATHFTSSAIGYGFAMVVSAIDAENYNNSVNNPSRESMNTAHVTQALVTQYILKYDTKANIIYKDEIKVLEVQPCKDYNFQTAAGKREMIEKWLPAFVDKQDKVTVTCMTIAELIGHNDKLSDQYDLVYIGSNTGIFNTKNVSVTLGDETENRTYKMANDDAMNGLIYSHVGDLGNTSSWGLIATDYSRYDKTQYRFPGMDLTTYKLEELKEFLNCGSPIIVADDFFTYNAEGSITATKTNQPVQINGGKVVYTAGGKHIYGILDTSSYMYQLVVYAVQGKDIAKGATLDASTLTVDWNNRAFKNFFYESAANEDNLSVYVNQQKLYLNLTSRPTEYSYTTTGTHQYIKDVTSLQPAADGKYYLDYDFSISSLGVVAANQTYDIKLFIDVNNDGKSSRTQEEMDSLVVTEIANGKEVVRQTDGYHLNAGVAYHVKRALPADYVGCIAWELVCTANNNKDIYASQRGYTVVQDPTGKKTELNILQITSGYSTGTGGDWATNGGKWTINANNLNLEEELRNGTSAWGQLLKNVPDFELDITTISTYGNNGLIARFAADPNYLDNFDMLIFGFGDGYSEIRYAPLLTAIENYANNGHCILFAHDTTWTETAQLPGYYSYTRENTQNQSWLDYSGNARYFADGQDWASGINDQRSRYLTQMVRKISGMDAYGITANGAARNGQPIDKGSAEWNELERSGKDIAFMPNTYQTKTVPNTQGANYTQLRDNLLENTDMVYAYDVSGSFLRDIHTYNNAQLRYAPSIVAKVNDGIITNYPYKIPDTFQVATTHNQYWALDLESDSDGDGESDLVVWYTMNDITVGDNGAYRDDLCSVSPYDARNNFYIYNMGNITYTGVGHTAVSNAQEVKLFINTMVASYIASIKDPGVRIVEDGSKQAGDLNNIMLPVISDTTGDSYLTEYGTDTVRVYFEVFDNNIVKGTRTITGKFYVDSTPIKLSIYDVKGNKLYDASSTEDANVLTSGSSYYVDIPKIAFDGKGAVDFTVEVYSDWYRNGVNVKSNTVSDSVTISKVELFDLD